AITSHSAWRPAKVPQRKPGCAVTATIANLRGATNAAPAPSIRPPYAGQTRPKPFNGHEPIPVQDDFKADGQRPRRAGEDPVIRRQWRLVLSNGLAKKGACGGQAPRKLGISLLPGPPRQFRLGLGPGKPGRALPRTTLRGTRRQGGPTSAIRRAALADGGQGQPAGTW